MRVWRLDLSMLRLRLCSLKEAVTDNTAQFSALKVVALVVVKTKSKGKKKSAQIENACEARSQEVARRHGEVPRIPVAVAGQEFGSRRKSQQLQGSGAACCLSIPPAPRFVDTCESELNNPFLVELFSLYSSHSLKPTARRGRVIAILLFFEVVYEKPVQHVRHRSHTTEKPSFVTLHSFCSAATTVITTARNNGAKKEARSSSSSSSSSSRTNTTRPQKKKNTTLSTLLFSHSPQSLYEDAAVPSSCAAGASPPAGASSVASPTRGGSRAT